jgi:hypothetical protein
VQLLTRLVGLMSKEWQLRKYQSNLEQSGILQSTSFNGGFISREAEARTDINSYQKSCREVYNMIPNIVGTVHKRVGTKYIGEIAGTGDKTKTKLITLVVADVLSYDIRNHVIHFPTALLIRVYVCSSLSLS